VKNNTKVPNPYEKDQTTCFEQTGDGGIRCIAAAFDADPQTHVVICAPDVITLKRFWAKITTQPLDLKKAPILLYKYEPACEDSKRPIPKADLYTEDYSWYYSKDKNQCFVDYTDKRKKHENINTDCIGKVEKQTIMEAKTLLRAFGIHRNIIERMQIYNDDPIPF